MTRAGPDLRQAWHWGWVTGRQLSHQPDLGILPHFGLCGWFITWCCMFAMTEPIWFGKQLCHVRKGGTVTGVPHRKRILQ